MPSQTETPRSGIHVFTGVAVNHIARARILCESVKRYHPEFVFHLALADKVPSWLDLSHEPFDDVIGLESLDIPNRTGWTFVHNITELCTAIKPFVLRRLLALDGCQQVFFFDADIVLFSRIDDLIEALQGSSLILTPHQTVPETSLAAIVDNEICSLRHGIYNLGFLGVRNVEEARRFVDWWAERLYHFCRAALDMHLWTDQKWINHVPVFFEGVRTIKSPRFNVAPWNITTRHLEGTLEKGFTVDGEPLAFYHFTGFDSGAHKIMAMKYAGDNPAVESLIRWYEQASNLESRNGTAQVPWSYANFQNGEPITAAHRIIYRIRKDLQKAFPDPFEVRSGHKSFHDWFRNRAGIEFPELFHGEDYAGPQSATKYQLRTIVDTLNYPRKGLLARLARLLLLAEHYRVWAQFQYQENGLKGVLRRTRRHIRHMLPARDKSASAAR